MSQAEMLIEPATAASRNGGINLGGGFAWPGNGAAGNGGSGVAIIRYPIWAGSTRHTAAVASIS